MVTGLIKKPNKLKLLKIKPKKLSIELANSTGKEGMFIHEKQNLTIL